MLPIALLLATSIAQAPVHAVAPPEAAGAARGADGPPAEPPAAQPDAEFYRDMMETQRRLADQVIDEERENSRNAFALVTHSQQFTQTILTIASVVVAFFTVVSAFTAWSVKTAWQRVQEINSQIEGIRKQGEEIRSTHEEARESVRGFHAEAAELGRKYDEVRSQFDHFNAEIARITELGKEAETKAQIASLRISLLHETNEIDRTRAIADLVKLETPVIIPILLFCLQKETMPEPVQFKALEGLAKLAKHAVDDAEAIGLVRGVIESKATKRLYATGVKVMMTFLDCNPAEQGCRNCLEQCCDSEEDEQLKNEIADCLERTKARAESSSR